MHAFIVCLMPDATQWRSFCSDWRRFTRWDTVDLLGAEESVTVYLNSFCQVSRRCQAVFDSEHSLHLWKRRAYTSTVERQLSDWRVQVTTWRDLRGLLYSHWDIAFINRINCTELQPSINVLIWLRNFSITLYFWYLHETWESGPRHEW
jgi:hypothetical protein